MALITHHCPTLRSRLSGGFWAVLPHPHPQRACSYGWTIFLCRYDGQWTTSKGKAWSSDTNCRFPFPVNACFQSLIIEIWSHVHGETSGWSWHLRKRAIEKCLKQFWQIKKTSKGKTWSRDTNWRSQFSVNPIPNLSINSSRLIEAKKNFLSRLKNSRCHLFTLKTNYKEMMNSLSSTWQPAQP